MDQQRSQWVYSLDAEMERARLLLERGIEGQRQLYVGESKRFLIMVDLAGGTERMLKIAWGMQVLQKKGAFPSVQEFKNAGHGLLGLADRVADLYSPDFLRHPDAAWAQKFLREDVVFRRALEILDEFARWGRYYHLDSLGGVAQGGDSPERAWERLELAVSHQVFPDPEEWSRRFMDLTDETLRLRVREYLAVTFEVFGCAMFRLFTVGLPGTDAKQWSVLWQSFLKAWRSDEVLGAGRFTQLG